MARARKGEGKAETEAPEALASEAASEDALDPGAREEASVTAPEDAEPTGWDTSAPEAKPEEEPSHQAPPQSESSRPRRGGLLPLVLGGAIAAGLGFGTALYVLPRYWVPEAPTAELDALKNSIAEQAARIDSLSTLIEAANSDAKVADLSAAVAALDAKSASGLADFGDMVAGLDSRVASAATRLDDVEARISALEKRPVAGGAASATALEAFGREMDTLRAQMAAQNSALSEARATLAEEANRAVESVRAAAAEAARIRTESEAAARRATARAALDRIDAALMAGGALDPALADLRDAGVAIPPPLAEQGQGVPTLEALRTAFPDAARDALAASLKETAAGDTWERLLAFLRTQSGARSLTPREGTDPDAILSRAEAALAAGDLAGSISEIGGLPAEGQARMTEWVALASRRISATEAAAALAAELQ
ncbi:MAG: hypothetical protein H6897_13185 [Rhodobacteraceae bacterium]|jgi:hypothetical protein|nr:hypothetical protein [uncultured Defluviimonas sp.]MCB2126758.1 hypothetical protein [Paracoccaceae bacterium]MCC0070869.1 hypothetical protein [Paracoccaceae bacterium]